MIPQITDAQLEQFERDGYFVLENVFTPAEMDELAGHIERFQQRHEEALRAGRRHGEHLARRRNHLYRSPGRAGREHQSLLLSVPEFVAISTQMLGPDIDLYWNQSVFKQPEGTKEFPWHQDDGYTPVEPSPYLTLWLALNDATPENGCISVMPGSHKRGLVPHEPSPIGLVCYSNEAPNQGVRVPVKAGSVAAFSSLTFHKSGPNTSDGPRKAYVIQYSKSPLRHADSGEPVHNEIAVARGGQAV
jgi:ectoine hydroxylase-related dioxygenase (phytanoyl-CoA dioxygenase family)